MTKKKTPTIAELINRGYMLDKHNAASLTNCTTRGSQAALAHLWIHKTVRIAKWRFEGMEAIPMYSLSDGSPDAPRPVNFPMTRPRQRVISFDKTDLPPEQVTITAINKHPRIGLWGI